MHCSRGKSNYGIVSIAVLSLFQVKSIYGNGPNSKQHPHMEKEYGNLTAGDPQAKKKLKVPILRAR